MLCGEGRWCACRCADSGGRRGVALDTLDEQKEAEELAITLARLGMHKQMERPVDLELEGEGTPLIVRRGIGRHAAGKGELGGGKVRVGRLSICGNGED